MHTVGEHKKKKKRCREDAFVGTSLHQKTLARRRKEKRGAALSSKKCGKKALSNHGRARTNSARARGDKAKGGVWRRPLAPQMRAHCLFWPKGQRESSRVEKTVQRRPPRSVGGGDDGVCVLSCRVLCSTPLCVSAANNLSPKFRAMRHAPDAKRGGRQSELGEKGGEAAAAHKKKGMCAAAAL